MQVGKKPALANFCSRKLNGELRRSLHDVVRQSRGIRSTWGAAKAEMPALGSRGRSVTPC